MIYPPELEIKGTTKSSLFLLYLDLCIEMQDRGYVCNMCQDDFNFSIANCPFMLGNIAFGVYFLHWLRYLTERPFYVDFNKYHAVMIRTLSDKRYNIMGLL